MSLLRTSIPVIRRAAMPKTLPAAVMGARGYADEPEPEFSQAHRRGQSSGFQKREQASEDIFVREQEQQKLKALREKLAKQREHLNEVEKAIDDLHKK